MKERNFFIFYNYCVFLMAGIVIIYHIGRKSKASNLYLPASIDVHILFIQSRDNHHHYAKLGLPDKGLGIKELVVCNFWNV